MVKYQHQKSTKTYRPTITLRTIQVFTVAIKAH